MGEESINIGRYAGKLIYEEQWRQYLRYELVPQQFPRQMQLNRLVVPREEDYVKFLHNNFDKMSCYTGVYSLPQIEASIIDTIYLEIDGINIPHATLLAEKLERALRRRRMRYRKYFSGRRGWHYYLDCPPVKLKNPRLAIRGYIRTLPSVIDTHVAGNIRQIVRVPYTIHQRTGLFCCRLYGHFAFREAIKPLLADGGLMLNDHLPAILEDIDDKIVERTYPPVAAEESSMVLFPPCIVECLSCLTETGKLIHGGRLHLVTFLHKAGFGIELVMNLFATHASDFKQGYTKDQLNRVARGRLRCYSCLRAHALGLCPYDEGSDGMFRCGFYPNMNFHLGKR